MKIEIRENNNIINYFNVKAGECFEYKETYFIKSALYCRTKDFITLVDRFYAVDLRTGEMFDFSDNPKVTLVNMTAKQTCFCHHED